MKFRKRSFFWNLPLILIFLFPNFLWGHEVVGEVTPLMLHANHILTFIKKGRGGEAIRMAQRVYEDFQEAGRDGLEEGLKTNSLRVDRAYGAQTTGAFSHSIREKDFLELKKGIEWLSFLLMVEKFDMLQKVIEQKNPSIQTQTTIFWLGRNYFSYLLEPTMGEGDPIEEKRLDRLLDRMLYSLEDKKLEQFNQQRGEFAKSVIQFFQFPVDRVISKEVK